MTREGAVDAVLCTLLPGRQENRPEFSENIQETSGESGAGQTPGYSQLIVNYQTYFRFHWKAASGDKPDVPALRTGGVVRGEGSRGYQ